MFDYLALADLVVKESPLGSTPAVREAPAATMALRGAPVASLELIEGTSVLLLSGGGYLYLHSQGRLMLRPRFN